MNPFAEEDQDLAELDDLLLVDVARGLEHDEDRVAVEVELGPLVCVDRVLDGELVEVELPLDGVELGRGRLVEPDPDERVVVDAVRERLIEAERLLLPLPFAVEREIDDHRGPSSRSERASARAPSRVVTSPV